MILDMIDSLSRHRTVDVRSLWLFRIGLGLYISYDVLTRLLPVPSIAWYTNPGFLHPFDSPHGNIIHRVWFARTSMLVQYLLFATTLILSFSLALGTLRNIYLQILLWTLVVSMQHRCMYVHDGSDNFVRQLLLWFLLQPSAVHHRLYQLNYTQSTRSSSYTDVSNFAVTGLLLQITLMYLGTVASRTIDVNFRNEDWLPPHWSAVWYIVRDSFAIRDYWLLDVLRGLDMRWTRWMTAHAMVVESSVILWFLLPNSSSKETSFRGIGFFLLFTLHFGLLLITRLTNWQLVGMIASVLWIPSAMWDRIWKIPHMVVSNKKSDEPCNKQSLQAINEFTSIGGYLEGHLVRRLLTRFFFYYMVYNFAGERKWITKHDDGNVGEFLRTSQHWVMYSSAPRRSCVTTIVGYSQNRTRHMDVMEGIRSGRWSWSSPASHLPSWTHVASPRWERVLDQWAARHDKDRARIFLQYLCYFIPTDESSFIELELRWLYYDIVPLGQKGRWVYMDSERVSVPCSR